MFERARILIWGKTYPELSAKYLETVCTGGVREDGRPIRLYPVPLRYLDGSRQYSLYDWIDIPIEKSKHDPRPESYRVQPEGISFISHVGTNDSWDRRRALIFKDGNWHFDSIAALKAAQQATGKSIGIVTPSKIEEVYLKKRPLAEKREYEKKLAQVQGQGDLFLKEYKDLEFLPSEIRLRWRCRRECDCSAKPHDMKALDWGLLELARRDGFEKARAKLESITDLRTHDFRIFMGNFRLYPKNFGIIGLWYPKLDPQTRLFG